MNAKIDENNMYFECEAYDQEGFRICIAPFYMSDDTELFMYSTTCNFDNLQRKWYHRLKLAIKILLGKEFHFHEVVLKKNDIIEFTKFLKNIKFKEN